MKGLTRSLKHAIVPVTTALFLSGACLPGSGSPIPDDTSQGDAGHGPADGTAALQDGGVDARADAAEKESSWQSILPEGDAQGDCQSQDASCLADIADMQYSQQGSVLSLEITFFAPFPRSDGSFEIFLVPEDQQIVAHSLRVTPTRNTWWDADCSSAPSQFKHAGCHWSVAPPPQSLSSAWKDDRSFLLSLDLDEAGLGGLDRLKVGVAAAPFVIQVTADFTDRFPDDLWVTATAINGLQSISLETVEGQGS